MSEIYYIIYACAARITQWKKSSTLNEFFFAHGTEAKCLNNLANVGNKQNKEENVFAV